MNDKLCPIPWMSQSLRSNGDIRICCQANQGPDRGLLRDSNGNVYNATDGRMQESRNSQLSKDIRKSMMNNKWHPECIRCEREVNANMRARIDYENDIWIDRKTFSWDYLLSKTEEDGTIDVDAIDCTFYDLRFGNLCNLSCRMCGATDSSTWYKDHVKLHGPRFHDSHGKVTLIKNNKGKYVPEDDVYSWPEKDIFWENMDERIPEIKKLYIVGGEPLMITKHYDFLQKCIDKNVAKDIIVEYNTNLTNVPERAYDIWKYFKQINIGASIDGFGKINDYMRPPSNFTQIHENLKTVSKAEGNYKCWIAATVNVFNVLHFPEFIEWIILNKLPRVNDDNWRPLITPHPLHRPWHYSIRMLPLHAKDMVKDKYAKYKISLCKLIDKQDWLTDRKDASKAEVHNILNSYIDFMYAEDRSENLPMFWEITRKLDKIRNHSIEEFIPELYDLIKDTEHTV